MVFACILELRSLNRGQSPVAALQGQLPVGLLLLALHCLHSVASEDDSVNLGHDLILVASDACA